MTAYDALLQSLPGRSAPDTFDFSDGKPSADFVVSRDIDGTPLSYYSDISWNRALYSSGRSTHLHFTYWKSGGMTPLRHKIVEELKWIMFLIIWRHPVRRATSTKTLNSNLSAMKSLARRAEDQEISLSEGFSDRHFLISTPRSSSSGVMKITGILQFLGVAITGFKIADDVLPVLSDASVTYAQSMKQTAPIPTRIYSHILSAISNEVLNLKMRMRKLVGMYAALKSGEGVGRSAHTRWVKGVRCPSFNDLLEEFDLLTYWPESGSKATINGFSSVLHEAQVMLSLQIQAYTGMRVEEVRNLPYDCLEESRRDGDHRIHYIIKGTVTKFSSGMERRAQWISIEAAAEAIRIAQQLAKAIYEEDGVTLNDLNSRKYGSLLFPAAGPVRNFVWRGQV